MAAVVQRRTVEKTAISDKVTRDLLRPMLSTGTDSDRSGCKDLRKPLPSDHELWKLPNVIIIARKRHLMGRAYLSYRWQFLNQ